LQLSSEDLLRLNVLLANDIEAIRVDEQAMTVHGLSGTNEASVSLNPNCRPEQYLRRVRELLSSHVLGSPGGYPVFLKRWTRMGQTKGGQLEKLLLLGEPEAVVAVAGAADLTNELARRAWWAQPTVDIARCMLERDTVIKGGMGKVLAGFLVEHLPFETDPLAIITTVRLILQPGLIDAETRMRIWSRGTHKNVYHLGFLEAAPNDLPEPLPPRRDYVLYADELAALAQKGNALAALLAQLLDSPGQTLLTVSEALLRHPVNHDAVVVLLTVIGNYFRPALVPLESSWDVSEIIRQVGEIYETPSGDLAELITAIPQCKHEMIAMLALAHAREALVSDILAKTTASGTLLQRKLEPVITPLLDQYKSLVEPQEKEASLRRRNR